MNKNIGCFVILIFLILIPTILGSYNTRIDVFAKPYEEVSVKILYDFGANEGRLIDSGKSSFNNVSDKNGIMSFFYESPEPLIRIAVKVVNETEDYRYFNRIFAGKRIFIDMTTTNSKPVVTELNQQTISTQTPNNDTKNQTNNQTNQNNQSILQKNETDNQSLKTSIQNQNKTDYKSMIIIYLLIVLGIFVLIFIILLIRRFLKRRQEFSAQPMQKIKFYPKGRPQSPEDSEDKEIKEAEYRIRQAQSEIEAIKLRKKEIKEAERKLQEDLDKIKQMKRR